MISWKKARLDDCCEIVAGATPSTSVEAYWDGDICWVTPKDLSDLEGALISDTPRKLTRAGLDSCAASILPAGSVLFSSRAPIGLVAVNAVPMATNQGFKSFIPKPKRVHAKFLYWWLRSHRSYLEGLGNGATFKEVSKAVVSRIEITLPTLLEQRRIAEVLDRAEALRAKRRAALAQLDTLTQAIFLDLFGDPATNPKGWPRKAVGELASKFSDGPFGSNLKSSHYTDVGVRVIRLQNIGVGEFVDDDKAYIAKEHFAALKKHECRPGDVLVGTLGEPNVRACIQPAWLPVALNKADCVQLRPDERVVNASYICALLNQPATERMAQELMRGQTRVRISMGRLRGLVVPVPSIEIQHTFALRVTAVEKLKATHRASLAELDALFASLQRRAFRGKL